MILAVDPGLATCGWAIVTPRTGAIVELGTFTSDREKAFDVSTDRIQRLADQAQLFADVLGRHDCTSVIGEAVTLGGPVHIKLAMSIGLHLSWGVLTELARSRSLPLYEVPPKVWQHEVQPGRKKIDYPSLEAAMTKHVSRAVGAQLACIPKADRNHALDACAIGMLLALQPQLATRVRMPLRITSAQAHGAFPVELRKDVTT